MTISSTTNTVSYTGNGSTTAFAVNYVFFGTGTSAEIEVVQLVTATGVETVKSNGSDFTVSGGNGATGTVTAAVAPASTVQWVINRTTTQTQETDYVENDPFPAESHEEALDRLTAIDQEQQRSLGQAVSAPVTDPTSIDMTLPSKDNRKGKYLAFNSTSGNPEAGASSDDVATLAAITDDISTLADIQDGTVATNAITISSANSTNIATVGGISANVTTVAGIASDVTAVAGDATDIGVVSGIAANVSTVAGISSNVTSVAGNATNVNKVAAVDANVTKVGNIDSDVTAVANIDSDVTTVAADGTDIGTVAGISANVTTVAGVASNVTTVAGVASNVTTVAGVASNVTTVAGVSSDVTTVAGISGDVSAVAAQVIGYDFSTTTAMADPGSGNVRFNNGTLASVSQIALDDLDKNGVDQSAYIALFDDSTNTVKGTLVFRTAGGDVATFNITGLTDNTGWNQIAVTHVASSGTFGNAEDTFIGFTRAGDKGADGEGAGDVVGPASSTDNTVARFNSTTGKLLQGSGVTIDDSNNVGAASLTLTTDLAVSHGGTGASDAAGARSNISAAALGANSDITSLTGLTTDLSVAQGGTGSSTASAARSSLGLAIGSDVQAFDANNALTDAAQTFTLSQRGTITTDNDKNFNQNATNNFKCTPSGAGALTFTNHTAGQSGNILLINSGGHAISLHANTKGDAKLATTISAAGTYWLSYFDDGTNAYVVTSAVFA